MWLRAMKISLKSVVNCNCFSKSHPNIKIFEKSGQDPKQKVVLCTRVVDPDWIRIQ
jgi:hypothetical protein